jgi:hypothetical protein
MNTQDKIINELAVKIANLTVEVATFKVLYNETQENAMQLAQEVESYRSVLESDKDLKELFEEIKNKNEVTK